MSQIQIHGNRQIKQNTIDSTRVNSSIIVSDGTNPFTANQSIGGNLLTNLGNPLSDLDAANKYYVDNNVLAGNGLYFVGKTLHIGNSASIDTSSDAIQISSTYAGQPSINTVGTITAGFWQASFIQPAFGGTGQNFAGSSGILKFNAGSALLVTAPSGALVGTSDVQVLSNKTIDSSNSISVKDSVFVLEDDLDSTKKVKFQVGNLTTNTEITLNFPTTTSTLATTSNKLSEFALTTSSELNSVIVDNTGSGNLVFSNSPSIFGGSVSDLNNLTLRDTSASFSLRLISNSSNTLTADRSLTFDTTNGNRTVKLAGNLDIANNFTTTGGFSLNFNTSSSTSLTLPTSGTLISTARYVVREIPSGVVNGSNATFTLVNIPTSNTEQAFLNGILLRSGVGNDYTITGNSIQFNAGLIPETGDIIEVSYIY